MTDLLEIIKLSENDEFKTTVTIHQITEAKKIINKRPISISNLFQVLCAMNLINAALKKKEFKQEVYYGMLKPKVSKLLRYVLENDQLKFDIKFYINSSEYCAYIEVYGLQFSFHNITIDEQLKEFIDSPKNKPKAWKGVRLQKIAGELFDYANNNKEA